MRSNSTLTYMLVLSLALHIIGVTIWFQPNLKEIGGVNENRTIINISMIDDSKNYRSKFTEISEIIVGEIHAGQIHQSSEKPSDLNKPHNSNKKNNVSTTKKVIASKTSSLQITQRFETNDFSILAKKMNLGLLHENNFTSALQNTGFRNLPLVNERSSSHVKKNYLSGLRKHIIEQKYYPLRAQRMGKQGRVSMEFVIYRDGHIKNINIQLSSGESILDHAAYKSIELMGTYLPFPHDIHESRLSVAVNLDYSLQ